MPNLEWEVPHTIQSSQGELQLNARDAGSHPGRYYMVQPEYKIVPSLRVTNDLLSQADGAVLHPRWKTGLVASLVVNYQLRSADDIAEYEPACGADLRDMHDVLMTHLNALRQLTNSTQRLLWTPTDYSNRRMLDSIQTLAWADPAREAQSNETGVAFALESPFPHAIDLAQTVTPIADGASATIVMSGSSAFKPVIKAHGPSTDFAITNETTGKVFSYQGTRDGAQSLGALQYAEIDMFRGTIVLNGDVLDLDAGVDPEFTDFWTLEPGANVISASGAAVDVLWNQAWS